MKSFSSLIFLLYIILISNIHSLKAESDPVIIDINSEIEKEYEIFPEKYYIINLNDESLAYFIESSVEGIIKYSESKICPRLCAFKDSSIKKIYINQDKTLKQKTTIKITSKSSSSNIFSSITKSPKDSGIYPISGTNIKIFQFSETNYFYADSYDNYVKMYLCEYKEEMTVSNILNLDGEYFTEKHGEIIELNPNVIYIISFVTKYSFSKIYLYNNIPSENFISNGNQTLLYLIKGNEYNLNFGNNHMNYIIKLNPLTNSEIDVITNSYKKTLKKDDKYFIPSSINENIKINNLLNDNALIEILFSFDDSETEIITEEKIENKIISKKVTLIEYSPKNENNSNLEIYLNSNNVFKLSAYGGISKNTNFYYYPSDMLGPNTNNYFIKLNNPLKNVVLEENEKYYISLIFEKKEENQEIKLSYYYNTNPIDDLYEDLDEDYLNNVISNLTSIIEAYAYIEIAQNPPQPENISDYNHKPIDLIGALNNIKRTNMKFYDFYREMREILGTVRDLHFRIFGRNTPSGKKLDQITACLPFSFYVSKDENNTIKMYIKYFESCAVYFTEEERKYIKERCDNKIPLKYINNKNPFDYIQEWGRKYRGNKSPHAHFTLMKTLIHSFYIRLYPYTPDELKMTFEFESSDESKHDILYIDYYIFVPNYQSVQKLYNKNFIFDENDFNKYFDSELKKVYKAHNSYEPNIFELLDKYNILKGNIKEKKKHNLNKIEWTYVTPEENGIKCRVDDINKINIFVQGSFSLDDLIAQEVMYNCTRDFYKNDYRIIGIQNRDGGGWAHLCLIFHQLVQVKTQDRAFKASRITDFFKAHVMQEYDEIINVETCKPFNSIDDLLNETIDDFSTEDKQLLHHRSKVFNYINKNDRKKLRKIREEFINYGHLKKPTDIIIYTDSFSYSATSSFVKGFQYQGGAILVGFNGNPFIGKEQFDGSQSPASVYNFDISDEYKNLINLGIEVSGITWAETYDDYYIQKNPIPREYLLDPVDERVDIYEPYSDDYYQLFIDKANEIFDKYNNKNECNPKNKKLTLEPDNNECYFFNDDKFAHGGYECGDDGKWTTNCRKYYCDLGYYYNQYKEKCERDICADDEGEEDIYLNGEYEKNIILNKDNNKEYIFHVNNADYIYFFESDNDNGFIHYGYNISCTKICTLQLNNYYDQLHINYYRNATNDNINIKVSSRKVNDVIIRSIKSKDTQINDISPISKTKNIIIFEGYIDYILYTKALDNSIEIKLGEYNAEMTIDSILNIDEKYFKNCNELTRLNNNKIYIIAFISEEKMLNKPFEILLQPISLEEDIISMNEDYKFLFISKEKGRYVLDFSNYNIKINLQLSRLTLDSEIKITEYETLETVTINKDNIYYNFNEIEGIFTGKILLELNNEKDALINIIFKYTDSEVDILPEREYSKYKVNKTLTIINLDNNTKDKYTKIIIGTKNNKAIKFSMYKGFSLKGFSKYSQYNMPQYLLNKYNKTEISLYNPNYELEKDESYNLFLFFDEEDILDKNDPILITKIDKYSIFDIDISEDKCKLVKESVIKLIEEGYIYTDIIKNPPNPQYFGNYDLVSELNAVKTNNRKYYEFFRDIRRVIGKMKDGHLNIVASKSPKGHDLKQMTMCLPFSFIVKGDDPSSAEIGIKIYEDCFKYYNKEIQDFIKNNINITLEKINNTDPFEFIQNLQLEFNAIHNKHGQFTRNMNSAHKLSINRNPLKKEQFENIEFIFKNGKNITLDYYLYYALEEQDLFNDDNFKDFYAQKIKKEINTLNEISILDIKKEYYENKLNSENKNEIIKWDYYTTDKEGLKCRVDNKNQVNIFIQTTFYFLDAEYNQALEVIDNCTEAFYNNSYPIIGIESNNGGGIIEVSLYLQQFLQVKILQRTHFSTKVSDMMKKEMEKDMKDIIELETCTGFNSFDDMKEIVDEYGEIDGKKIEHHRTKIFELFNSTVLKEHKQKRKKYFEKYNLKKPTEIIIFTDSFSYSSTSFFIKGLQETGGAILVGYKGNPKENQFFEASHSPSAVSNFNGSDVYNNLIEAGFELIGASFFESFNYSYQEKNPTPREYLIHPVDERVNIYQNYDDSLYQKFVDEAKIIFKDYNERNKCNSNNKRLLLDPNNKKECYVFNDDKHAHGGYLCGDNGEWSDICAPYYCDIGYYFDVYKNKCILDQCTDIEEKSDDEDDSFPVWAIIITVVGAVLIILIAVIIILLKFRKKDDDKNVGLIMEQSRSSYE